MMTQIVNGTFGNATCEDIGYNHPNPKPQCYHLYEISRSLYLPLLHMLVIITGLVVNLIMLMMLHRARSEGPHGRRRKLGTLEFVFSFVGVCDVTILLLTIPVSVTDALRVEGRVFGYLVCKLTKGLISFCFQYGILLMVYVNIERFITVVRGLREPHNKKRSMSRRRFATRLCACMPALFALLDMCYFNVRHPSGNSTMCFYGMRTEFKDVLFWIRIIIDFILPFTVLIYCNGMVVYSVKKHIEHNALASNMKRAQVLPVLTVTFFVCCWIPWIASTIYYRSHEECDEIMYVVLSVCKATGNMHCTTSPALYLIMRYRGGARNYLSSFRSSTSLPQLRRSKVRPERSGGLHL